LIPVTRSGQDPNKEEQLKEFEKIDFDGMKYGTAYVREKGWATMPGGNKPDSKVSGELANPRAKLKLQGASGRRQEFYLKMNGRNKNGKVM
jgi:hypothetical protein